MNRDEAKKAAEGWIRERTKNYSTEGNIRATACHDLMAGWMACYDAMVGGGPDGWVMPDYRERLADHQLLNVFPTKNEDFIVPVKLIKCEGE